MDITISQNIPCNKYSKMKTNSSSLVSHSDAGFEQPSKCSSFSLKDTSSDTFIPYQNTKSGNVSFSGKFFSALSKLNKTNKDDNSPQNIPNEFAADISSGIKRVMQKDIPPSNFSFVMTPDEFRELLPSFNAENFISSKENQENGIYCVDLDYQSTFSSGLENVFDILDNAAEYADKYYEKTGKEFIFAVTDRDCIEGLQHLLRTAGSDPEKYKHLKIVPGLKMSFAHKAPNSTIGYENSDMLIYGINPFSKNIIDFVDTTINKRKKMMVDFIGDVNELYPEFSYNVIEFAEQNRMRYKKSFGVPNLYWRAREYAETKGDTEIKGISMVPDEIIEEAQAIIDDLGKVYLGSDQKTFSAWDSQIITNNDVNKEIKKVFGKYSTHKEESGKVVSSAENLYESMIDCLDKEKEKPVLAIASPFYFSHYYEEQKSKTFDKVVSFFKELKEHSKGMLLAFESIVPFYDLDENLTPAIIKNFNEYIQEHTDLYEVGGSFAKRNQEN